MKENTKMQRRMFLRTVAIGGVATAANLTSMSPRKVFSQTKEEWRVINNWGQEPDDHMKLFAKMVSEGTDGRITHGLRSVEDRSLPIKSTPKSAVSFSRSVIPIARWAAGSIKRSI